jgi:hypothetical protein
MGSARLGYGAECVLLLEQPREVDHASATVPLTLTVAKGRDGMMRSTIPLIFHHTQSRFIEDSFLRQQEEPKVQKPVTSRSTSGKNRNKVDPLAGAGEE